jgi:hypothetical protein
MLKLAQEILYMRINNMTASLSGFFWGLVFGGTVLGLIAVALLIVSQKDKVVRR